MAMEESSSSKQVIAAMASVLPWLDHRDLASVACCCSQLASVASAVISLRVADAARGLEPCPVPIINDVDSVRYPFFLYSASPVLPYLPLQPSQSWGTSSPPSRLSDASSLGAPPCSCVLVARDDDDAVESRPSKRLRVEAFLCGRILGGGLAYDGESRLRPMLMSKEVAVEDAGQDFLVVMECGPACACDARSCEFRVTQRGLAVRVCIVKDRLKGWSLKAAQFISRGAFVFEYAGEFLTTLEAQARQVMYDEKRKTEKTFAPALLVLREHLPSGNTCIRWNIDATRVGNVARFVNHSCDGGNLHPCLTRMTGSLIPKLVFFARRDILEEEELTFSYGETIDDLQTRPCFCGTTSCKGFLPFEET